ncbi:PREDICTED: proteoglycan 4-like, partial [Priapulus caudatus]|uniref:Proteoglycan 4-like n=1 Tax=Priapulus caudatus TaxID=37621 RepID=A0ABM1F6Z4_PRICU
MDYVDPEIAMKLSVHYGITKAEMTAKILRWDYDYLTATYLLLMSRKQHNKPFRLLAPPIPLREIMQQQQQQTGGNHDNTRSSSFDQEYTLANSSLCSSLDNLDDYDFGCAKFADSWGAEEVFRGGENTEGAAGEGRDPVKVTVREAEVAHREKMVITLTSGGGRQVNVSDENVERTTPRVPQRQSQQAAPSAGNQPTPSGQPSAPPASDGKPSTPDSQQPSTPSGGDRRPSTPLTATVATPQQKSSKNERAAAVAVTTAFQKETTEKMTPTTEVTVAPPRRSPQVYKRRPDRFEDKENFAIPKIPTPKRSSKKYRTPPVIDLFTSCTPTKSKVVHSRSVDGQLDSMYPATSPIEDTKKLSRSDQDLPKSCPTTPSKSDKSRKTPASGSKNLFGSLEKRLDRVRNYLTPKKNSRGSSSSMGPRKVKV